MRIVLVESLGVDSELVQSAQNKFHKLGHTFVSYPNKPQDDAELKARVLEADVVIIANLPFPDQIINECKNLKMISVAFTGVDHIGLEACKSRGITVCNSAGYSTASVAELTFGLMISVLRNITACDRATRAGGTKDGLIGHDLAGKTLGIIGTGTIGTKVAEIGHAFGCKLLATSRTKKQAVTALGAEYTNLDSLLSASDIVTIHTALNADTKNLINQDKLNLMKPSAILINTARGPIVDNTAYRFCH